MTSYVTWAMLGIAFSMAVGVIAYYNRFIGLGRRCDQAFADIDVQLKQRHDLIPNLVETVKGYAGHERGTLEAVINARAAAQGAPSNAAKMQAEAGLSAALGRLMVVTEAYPDLKASANFSTLQDELSDIENKMAAARRYLNNAVGEFNATREQFPGLLVAAMFGIGSRSFYDVGRDNRQAMDAAAPAVRF
jgi:LemA protein